MTAPVTWTPSAEAALKRLAGRLYATTTEVCAITGGDPRQLRKAILAGEVPAIRAGNTYRIPVSWLHEHKAGAAPPARGPQPPTAPDPELLADAVADRIIARLAQALLATLGDASGGEPAA